MVPELEAIDPGGDVAVNLGCTCGILDDAHLRQITANGEQQFWVTEDCPLHGKNKSLYLHGHGGERGAALHDRRGAQRTGQKGAGFGEANEQAWAGGHY